MMQFKHAKYATGALLAAAMAMPLLSSSANASTIMDVKYDQYHLRAGAKQESVGQIIQYNTLDHGDTNSPKVQSVKGVSSGVVIADQWFLTAAHCVSVSSPTDRAGYHTIRMNGQTYVADQWYVPTDWSWSLSEGTDIALIRIQGTFDPSIKRERVNGLKSTMIGGVEVNNTRLALSNEIMDVSNKKFEGVGYGNTGTGATGQIEGSTGRRRAFWNKYDVHTGQAGNPLLQLSHPSRYLLADFDSGASKGYLNQYLEDNKETFDWDTDYPVVLEGSIAQGDSGGPDFVGGDVVGIHSFGLGIHDSTNFGFHDVTGSVATAEWAEWILGVMQNNSTVMANTVAGGQFNTLSRGTYDDQLFANASEAEVARIEALLDEIDPDDNLKIRLNGTMSEGVFAGLAMPDEWKDVAISDAQLRAIYGGDYGFELGYTVPEPASLALLGLGGLALLRRRK